MSGLDIRDPRIPQRFTNMRPQGHVNDPEIGGQLRRISMGDATGLEDEEENEDLRLLFLRGGKKTCLVGKSAKYHNPPHY
jgi:hypothetical protein